ncbi:MAG: hypothetical protein HQM13_13760 [SAR324 cluster bacterium]|nr:hypothetical protein [SAR324 cluster bacterium]
MKKAPNYKKLPSFMRDNDYDCQARNAFLYHDSQKDLSARAKQSSRKKYWLFEDKSLLIYDGNSAPDIWVDGGDFFTDNREIAEEFSL